LPANLPLEAQLAGKKYEEAVTIEERMKTLQVYISKIPKHKGTGKLRLKLRRDLAKLEEDLEKRTRHRKMISSGAKSPWSVEKHGGGLVALVGVTNSGKSALLAALTGANTAVGEYEFTTNEPVVGATKFEDVVFSVVDLPSIVDGSSDGRNNGRKVFGVIRTSSLILLVCDLTKDVDAQLDLLMREFDRARIKLTEETPSVKIERTGVGGIHVFGRGHYNGDIEELKDLLRESGLTNGTVHIYRGIDVEGVIDALDPRIVRKRAVVVGSKGDVSGTSERFDTLVKNWGKYFPIIGISVDKEEGFDELNKALYDSLGIIRVYTKEPGRKPTDDPLLLKKESTIRDVCRAIHKSFENVFRYARVFGKSVKFEGIKVGLDHKLEDKDVVELRLS
jgi:ribosome-interacting GTPase 1